MTPLPRFIARSILALACWAAAPAAMALPTQESLQAYLAAQSHPMAVFIAGEGAGAGYGAAAGLADPAAGRPMTVETPLRVASNTKTFTAAAALRLWETGRLDLDSPIAPLISPEIDALLRADGYDTDTITVRHLLSHSAGIFDHAADPRYLRAAIETPDLVRTIEDLVGLATEYGDPLSPPGTRFSYADTGYVLLGHIIQRITGENLGWSVRSLLRLDRLDLGSTWWEMMEEPRPDAPPRARQGLGTRDMTDLHPSFDLYGGGGLLMSARDLALFTAALFEGRIFDRPETLEEMLWQGPHQGGDIYRLGTFVKQGENGRKLYWHGGFWGTIVYYNPDTRIAVAGVVTNQAGYGPLDQKVERIAAGEE